MTTTNYVFLSNDNAVLMHDDATRCEETSSQHQRTDLQSHHGEDRRPSFFSNGAQRLYAACVHYYVLFVPPATALKLPATNTRGHSFNHINKLNLLYTLRSQQKKKKEE
jgi:hypothetical protein